MFACRLGAKLHFFDLSDLVLASAGEDGRVSLWRKNGQSLWMVPAKNARGETVEVHCLKLRNYLLFLFRSYVNLSSNSL